MDVDELIDRARSMWRLAASGADTGRVELYLKASHRLKVARDEAANGTTIDRARESGLAIRTSRSGSDRAGFAAASGLSDDVVRWTAEASRNPRALVSADAPGTADPIANERRDLDAAASLPTSEALTEWVMTDGAVEWVEAGTTVEVLVGFDGWVAARRRNRVWALAGDRHPGLFAKRGFAGWDRLLDHSDEARQLESHPNSSDPPALVLGSDAAAVVVAALAESFHGKDAPEWVEAGHGWSVIDEPTNPEGLAGGEFDDVGFPTVSRELANVGLWVGGLTGPGSFHRSSFREPPIESASNLVVAPGSTKPMRAKLALHCRLLRASSSVWVLELDFADRTAWVRTGPLALLAGCAGGMGAARTTAAGPIVPALVFEGLPTN